MLERAIGSILVCASQNIGMFIEGRIVNGLVGIESAQVLSLRRRAGTALETRSLCRSSAMGYYVGNHDCVLVNPPRLSAPRKRRCNSDIGPIPSL